MTINWPDAFGDRTQAAEREHTHRYEVTLNRSIRDLEREMERLGVDQWRLETNLDHQSQNPNYPYANQPEPDDPGVVLRWSMEGEQYAIGCDRYTRVRDNLRTIGLYVKEKRKMENRPVETGFDEFATARLPPGDPERDGVTRQAPHEILEVSPDASPDVIKAVARRKMANAHPDKTGDDDEFIRIQKARDRMLEEGEA